MNKTSEEKLNEWKNLIAEKKQSKLKIKDFCKEKNITPAQYYYYHAIINSAKKADIERTASKIAPIKIINSHLQEQSFIRLILPNSLQCFLPRNMSLPEIKSMLEVLMSC